ncbi:MAG TPA: MBL fold metallo-hydrolase [Bacteroidales bacterium]|nr:MBL fold metallo-hydrolase [Bacteroidales bacterium]
MKVFTMVFSPIEVNTYIVADPSGKCIVIDCGCYTEEEFEKLTSFIKSENLKPVLLLNTHCHLDHIFGNGRFFSEYGLGTLCHKEEEKNRKNAVMFAGFFGLQMDEPPEPAGLIEDNQTIVSEILNFKALHVPGHSPGSLAFYCEKGNMVFTGDALFAGTIGRTDLPGGDYNTLVNSIKNKLFTLPPSTVVYPGHGKKTTIGNEIATNPFLMDKRKNNPGSTI